MDENTNNDIFVIMQKVLDKLKNISEDSTKSNKESENIHIRRHLELGEEFDKIYRLVKLAHRLILDSENKIINTIEKNKTTPNANNYTEYSLFGNKSHFKPWILVAFFFGLTTIWCSIKYLPSYLTEKSLLSKEREEYQLFYNYVYLKHFKKDELNVANDILKKIKQKDTLFMKEYHTILNNHQRQIKKQELEEELKSLENDDS